MLISPVGLKALHQRVHPGFGQAHQEIVSDPLPISMSMCVSSGKAPQAKPLLEYAADTKRYTLQNLPFVQFA